MIVPDELSKPDNGAGAFDPHAGIVSPPPSYAELAYTHNQPGGTRPPPQAMPAPHVATHHAASLPPPSIPHHQHYYGRHQTMPEQSSSTQARFAVVPQPTADMAAHLDNVRYHEVQKVRVEEERRASQYGMMQPAPPSPANRPSMYTSNTDVSSIPTQETGTSMDKIYVALNPNPPMPPPPSQIKTQPSFQNSMSVRNVRRVPTNANGDREWTHGCCKSMFDECGMCCCACWCPCIAYSKIKSRVSHLERNNYPHPSGGDGCTSDCFIHGLLTSLCGIGWVMQIGLRSSVRDRYRIGGGACGDMCCSWCCTPCSLAQESLEVELEEQALMGSGKWGSPQK